jgi:hypothetical protein
MLKKKYYIILLILLSCNVYNSFGQNDQEYPPKESPYNEPDKVYTTKESIYEKGYELREFSDERMQELKSKKEFNYDERKIAEQQKQDEKKYNQENRGGGNGSGESKTESKTETREQTTRNIPINNTDVDWTVVLIIFGVIVLALLLALGFKPSFLIRKNTANVNMNTENAVTEEDINSIKFESELEKAIRLKNYKLAVRIMYLEVLKNLNDKQLIDWKKNKTNLDYVREIKNVDLKPDFRQITNSFDYVWYGNFNIDNSTFQLMQDKIQTFKKRI